MKHKTIQQLRDRIKVVLKRRRPKQLKKLQKSFYIIRREAESVADGKRVCTNRKEAFEPCDPFYVNVKTGEYDFRSSLIRKYGKDEFARMVAYGVYVNELRYQKQLTAEEAKEQQMDNN